MDYSISVIIPAYNAESFLADTLESVYAQTLLPLEIIVVDDGSSDGTGMVAQRCSGRQSELIYVWQKNAGPSRARNAGIERARGTWIAFLDADDLWVPDKLERQIEFLRAHPDVALLCSDASQFRESDDFSFPSSHQKFGHGDFTGIIENPFGRLLLSNPILTGTVLVKTEVIRAEGGFDENMVHGEDYDLWLRIALTSQVACQPLSLMQRRLHDDNLTSRQEPFYHAKLDILKKIQTRVAGNAEWRELVRRNYLESWRELAYFYYLNKQYCRAAIALTRYLVTRTLIPLTANF